MAMIRSGSEGTGMTAVPASDLVVPFGRFEITVRVGPGREFLGITQIAIKRDFLSEEQRIAAEGSVNASDLYGG